MAGKASALIALGLPLLMVVLFMANMTKRSVKLEAFPRVCFSPCTITLRAIVEPNSDQHRLDLALDCDSGFYTSHATWLEGDGGPRLTLLRLPDLPQGSCEATAALILYNNRIATVAHATVLIQ